jgi:hypothetical protein
MRQKRKQPQLSNILMAFAAAGRPVTALDFDSVTGRYTFRTDDSGAAAIKEGADLDQWMKKHARATEGN